MAVRRSRENSTDRSTQLFDILLFFDELQELPDFYFVFE